MAEIEALTRDEFQGWMAYLALIGEHPHKHHQQAIKNARKSREFREVCEG